MSVDPILRNPSDNGNNSHSNGYSNTRPIWMYGSGGYSIDGAEHWVSK